MLTGGQLRSGGAALVEALVARVSNMRIHRTPGRCPIINLRGQRTLVGMENPAIYVDGTRVVSTCSLDQIRSAEVERIEIYSGGASTRLGYRPDPNGMLFVFLITEVGR